MRVLRVNALGNRRLSLEQGIGDVCHISRVACHVLFAACLGAALSAPSLADVPPPRPVKTQLKVGSYYFPGFFNAARWAPLKAYGKPVPLLGYYRDGVSGVSDWHIKWALENGISYFVFDWYYDHVSGHVAEHNAALEQGFLKARYAKLMDFALMWCNEEPADSPLYTLDQMMTLGKTLGRYFREANYLRIDGRPLVIVSRPDRIVESFGAEFKSVRQQISQAAGLDPRKPIYFVALASEPRPIHRQIGFEATTAYNYAGIRVGKVGSRLRIPYEDMIEGYEQIWRRMTGPDCLPYIVPVSPGWDSRPWYGPKALVHTGSTPDKYRQMCERARKYVNPKLRMVISECWNEFGEGSYIEPCEEFGFEYLHALRDVYGLSGPYPKDIVPTAEERRRFTFQTIPPIPSAQAEGKQAGNLLADPGMEEGTGWVNFGGASSRLVPRGPHEGKQCLEVRPGEGCKAITPTPVVFQRTYRFSAWVKCGPGATGRVSSALFDRDGRWTGGYCPIGQTISTTWAKVDKTLRVSDPGVGAMNLEFVAERGAIWVDDASIVVVALEPSPEVVFEDDCTHAEGWVTYEGKPVSLQPVGADNKPVIAVPAGTGIKTRKQIEVSPGTVLRPQVWLRCEPMATAVIQSAAFDERGQWMPGIYLSGGAFSWQDWVEVPSEIRVVKESKAKYVNVECYAEGGQVLLGGVKIVAGRALNN